MPAVPDLVPAGPVELRRWRPVFIDHLMAAIRSSRPELEHSLPWASPLPTRDAELEVLREGEAAFDADEEWAYCLFEVATDELVGGAALHRRDPDGVEIGYWVRSDRHRRGYATTASGALTKLAFAHLPRVQWVRIRMDRANVASAGVPPKLGYVLDDDEELRERLTPDHTGRGWVWVMTRERWDES